MTTTAVDIVVKVAGGQKLDKLNRDLKGLDGTTKNLASKLPAAQAGLRNTGAAAKQAASGVQVLNAAFAKITVVLGVVSGAVAAFNAGIAHAWHWHRWVCRRVLGPSMKKRFGQRARKARVAGRAPRVVNRHLKSWSASYVRRATAERSWTAWNSQSTGIGKLGSC